LAYHAALASPERRLKAYRRFWDAVAQDARVRWALTRERPSARAARSRSGAVEADVIGFHPPEYHEGKRFRWTSDLAGIWIPVAPHACRLVLTMLMARIPRIPWDVNFCMNGKIMDARHDLNSREIRLDIEPHHFDGRTGE